ncbi:hypothetical protein [Streptomyces avicenniae]|nr:hypothetical protein [Streptomyces avicenniae]
MLRLAVPRGAATPYFTHLPLISSEKSAREPVRHGRPVHNQA